MRCDGIKENKFPLKYLQRGRSVSGSYLLTINHNVHERVGQPNLLTVENPVTTTTKVKEPVGGIETISLIGERIESKVRSY